MTTLSRNEAIVFRRLVCVVNTGLGAYDLVSQALNQIDDDSLYRDKATTFDQFTRNEWGFRLVSRYARTRIEGEVDPLIARAVKDLPPEARLDLFKKAQEGTKKDDVTCPKCGKDTLGLVGNESILCYSCGWKSRA